MSKNEKALYDKLLSKGRSKIDRIIKNGFEGHSYSHVFQVLCRLRQLCDHVSMVFSAGDLQNEATIDEAIEAFFESIILF